MAQIVSLLLACQLSFCLAVAAHSALMEREGSRLVAVGLVLWCGLALAGLIVALGW